MKLGADTVGVGVLLSAVRIRWRGLHGTRRAFPLSYPPNANP